MKGGQKDGFVDSVESESGCDDVGFVEESTIKFALVPEYVLALMCRF